MATHDVTLRPVTTRFAYDSWAARASRMQSRSAKLATVGPQKLDKTGRGLDAERGRWTGHKLATGSGRGPATGRATRTGQKLATRPAQFVYDISPPREPDWWTRNATTGRDVDWTPTVDDWPWTTGRGQVDSGRWTTGRLAVTGRWPVDVASGRVDAYGG